MGVNTALLGKNTMLLCLHTAKGAIWEEGVEPKCKEYKVWDALAQTEGGHQSLV